MRIFDRFVITCIILMSILTWIALAIGSWGYYVQGYDFGGTDAIVEEHATTLADNAVPGYTGLQVPVPEQDWIVFALGATGAGFLFGWYWTKLIGDAAC